MQNLKSRIRGWFPQEPFPCSITLNLQKAAKQPPSVIPPQYTLGATKFAAAFAVFWAALYGFMFFAIFPNELTLSVLGVTVWASVGAASGIIMCWALAQLQLGPLSREYHYNFDDKTIILTVLMIVCFVAFVFLAGWAFYGFRGMLSPISFLVYPWGVSFTVTRAFLFADFERKQNMRIVQSWWGTDMFLIPKPPETKWSAHGRSR